jgi:hypothetical protein
MDDRDSCRRLGLSERWRDERVRYRTMDRFVMINDVLSPAERQGVVVQ